MDTLLFTLAFLLTLAGGFTAGAHRANVRFDRALQVRRIRWLRMCPGDTESLVRHAIKDLTKPIKP